MEDNFEIKGNAFLINTKTITKYRIVKTILLSLIWVSMGFNIEIFSPALEDLKILFNMNYETYAIILIMRTIGNIIATLITGLTLNRFLEHSTMVIIVAKLIFIIR